jgi:sulfatase maturation enzyme AslB (radical SAM superfamily)
VSLVRFRPWAPFKINDLDRLRLSLGLNGKRIRENPFAFVLSWQSTGLIHRDVTWRGQSSCQAMGTTSSSLAGCLSPVRNRGPVQSKAGEVLAHAVRVIYRPGLRFLLSGCLLRCSYCHNPDSWHLKDGTPITAGRVMGRLAGFASALRALDGGLTISGGEPLAQIAFTRRILSAAKKMALHTAIETSGYLGDRVDDSCLSTLDLILLDIKS